MLCVLGKKSNIVSKNSFVSVFRIQNAGCRSCQKLIDTFICKNYAILHPRILLFVPAQQAQITSPQGVCSSFQCTTDSLTAPLRLQW